MARRLMEMAIVAILYVVTGKLGFFLAIPPGNVTTVWPPSGIALAAVLLGGPRLWPGIWVGSFVVNAWFFLEHGPWSIGAVAVAGGIAAGSTAQALLGAFLIQRWVGSRDPLSRARDVFRFTGITLLNCVVAASFGVTSLCVGRFVAWSAYRYTWWTWWVGDLIGILVVTPLVLAWSKRPRWEWTPWRLGEAILLMALVLTIGRLIFGSHSADSGFRPPPFMLVPSLVWAAFRFGQPGVMLMSVVVSGIAIGGTVHGQGPFAKATLNESLLLLQFFVGIVTMTGLLMAAAIMERQRAEEALRSAHDALEQRVAERTVKLTRANRALELEVAERTQAETRLMQTNELLITKQRELLDALGKLARAHRAFQDTQLQLIQAAKLESVGRLAAGVAHEVKNPLAAVLMGVEYLSKHLPEKQDNLVGVLNDIEEAVRRADKIIKGLLDFSAPTVLQVTSTNLNRLIEQALLLVKHELSKCHVNVVNELDGRLPLLMLDAAKIEQVFVNLFLNALDATPAGGTLSITTSSRRVTEQDDQAGRRGGDRRKVGDLVVIAEVSDTGTGIPKQHLSKIFDPFFTTKPTGKGTGLGLAVTKTIVELHGGAIEVRNRPGGGAQVTLLWKATS